jgi:hypothetical protein
MMHKRKAGYKAVRFEGGKQLKVAGAADKMYLEGRYPGQIRATAVEA